MPESLDEFARTDLLLDALAQRRPVDVEDPDVDVLTNLLEDWRDNLRWPPASALVTPEEAVNALRTGLAERRNSATHFTARFRKNAKPPRSPRPCWLRWCRRSRARWRRRSRSLGLKLRSRREAYTAPDFLTHIVYLAETARRRAKPDYGSRGTVFGGKSEGVQLAIGEAAESSDHLVSPQEAVRIAMARQ